MLWELLVKTSSICCKYSLSPLVAFFNWLAMLCRSFSASCLLRPLSFSSTSIKSASSDPFLFFGSILRFFNYSLIIASELSWSSPYANFIAVVLSYEEWAKRLLEPLFFPLSAIWWARYCLVLVVAD